MPSISKKYNDICKMPNNLQIYQFPPRLADLGFSPITKDYDYWATVTNEFQEGQEERFKIEIFSSHEKHSFYGLSCNPWISYPSKPIQTISLNKSELESFKYMISPQWENDRYNAFKGLIPDLEELKLKILTWTKSYFDLFDANLNLSDLEDISESAEESIIRTIYKYYLIYLEHPDAYEITSTNPPSESWNEELLKLNSDLDRDHFFLHYPFLKTFITKLGIDPREIDGMSECNYEFNMDLLEYACSIPRQDI